MSDIEARLKSVIRDVPDFPKPGIVFKDITPVLASAALLTEVTEHYADRYRGKVDAVVGMESRGFIFGTPIALSLGAAFVPARKPGKLPYQRITEEYALEYGTASLDLHVDAIRPGQRVLIVDDLIATGGTAAATARLVERLGGVVVGMAFVIELTFLPGRQAVSPHQVDSIVRY
ncbi:MAG: adenine phosphoribosyltransferase [Myxococcales bacterium]|nr:adenine phosphoribosyltransferase [Myxococcales bacterium]